MAISLHRSPDTPQSASYRANVNRTKTRKWVEAKTQNYDGDDWGADDDDEPAPVPAVPSLRPSGSRQASYASGRLPSEPPMPSIVPQQHQHQPLVERPRDSGPPPALHIQTQPQAPPGGDLYAAGPDRATERRASPQPDPYQRLQQEGPSAESPKPLHDDLPSRASDRSTPPLSQEPAAAYYAAYDQAQSARPNNQSPPPSSGAFGKAAAAPNLQETIASGRDAHGPEDAPAQPQHLLQEQPQPQSSADPNLTSDAPSSHQERPARDSDDQTGHATQPPQFADYPDSSHAEETKRFSTSPQLPDLARMSMFGDDLFSGSANRFSSDAPPVPTLPEEPSSYSSPQHDQPSFSATAADAGAQSSSKSIDASPELPTSNMTTDAPQAKASPSPSPSPSPQPAAEPALAPPKPFRPSLPGDWVSDSVRSVDQGSYNERDPSVYEGSQKPSAGSFRDTDSDAGAGRSASPAVPVSSSSPETIRPSASSPNDFAGAGIHPVNTVQDDFAPPEVLNRQNTLSTIASPSPIKESDKLREEIIRTLSPVRPTHEPITTSQPQEPITEKEPVRESTYLHGVYDDYWTGGDDKQATEPQTTEPESRPSNAAVVEPLPEIQPLSPRSPLRDPSAEREYPSIDSRPRRFSWEGGAEDTGEDSDKETGPAAPQVQPVPVVDVGSTKPVEPATSVAEPEAESSVRGGSELPSRLAENARLNSQDNASQISHQVSQVSSLPRGGDQSFSAAPQPPSPVSGASEATPMAEPKSLSLSDEKAIGSSAESAAPKIVTDDEPQGVGASISPPHSSGPPSPHPAPQAPVKIMSFREILELPNAADRITKYDETRQQFAQMDSGLGNWLVNVKAQHPDHANASASFNGAYVPMPGTPHGLDQAPQQAAAGGGGAAPTQQPYYQQYLNASSPTTSSTPHAGRPLTGTLGGGSLPSASDFKHSSGQVGAKGKGLLLAAGKAGKGLLSKGKDKLRRDKVFP
jgi:hypothetical protein